MPKRLQITFAQRGTIITYMQGGVLAYLDQDTTLFYHHYS
jgi:hypothetical protein